MNGPRARATLSLINIDSALSTLTHNRVITVLIIIIHSLSEEDIYANVRAGYFKLALLIFFYKAGYR